MAGGGHLLFSGFMPDSLYTIHTHGLHDSIASFYSYAELKRFLDTTTAISDTTKALILQTVTANHMTYPATTTPILAILFVIVAVTLCICAVIWALITLILNLFKGERNTQSYTQSSTLQPSQDYTIYKGNDLNITNKTVAFICEKYNVFFRDLALPDRAIFIERLQQFMQEKTFYIYAGNGYREMPVLLSATATQLGFGFRSFHLDAFPYFAIHPKEYVAVAPLRILAGNVQGNTISISWEHFLKDNLHPTDGNNVGLHEMAHAFAMQMLYSPAKMYKQSTRLLREFLVELKTFIYLEKLNTYSLFDSYSLQSSDECWAKSIELFFERPSLLSDKYPAIYKSIKAVLNQ